MKILAEKDSINLSLELPETEIFLTGDEEKLSRALTNLVSNCMRYAENLITVKVSMPQELPILQVTISDDGRGFEDKDLLHLFERFYKGENGNFGLGLTIVKTIIERHNGTIEAKNGPTGGAQFIITLPHIVRE